MLRARKKNDVRGLPCRGRRITNVHKSVVGIAGPKGLAETTAEAWDNTLNVNLRGAMLTARAALPVMEPGSAFVFISSIGALGPRGRLVGYSSSKLAMAAVTRDVGFAGKERSIRANIVMPGGMDGVELARTVMARWPALRVVLTSGFPEARLDRNDLQAASAERRARHPSPRGGTVAPHARRPVPRAP